MVDFMIKGYVVWHVYLFEILTAEMGGGLSINPSFQ